MNLKTKDINYGYDYKNMNNHNQYDTTIYSNSLNQTQNSLSHPRGSTSIQTYQYAYEALHKRLVDEQ